MKRAIHAWRMGVRVSVAAILGYLVTANAVVALALLLPQPPVIAVTNALLLSFALYIAILIWSFSVTRLRIVCSGLGGTLFVLVVLNHVWLETSPVLSFRML